MNAKITTNFPTASLIDGQWVTSTKTFPVLDPATGSKLADVPDLTPDDARRAIDAAHKAFPAWAAKPAKDRAVILRRWFDLIIAETEALAQLMTAEQGKPFDGSPRRGRLRRLVRRMVCGRRKARLRPHDPDDDCLAPLRNDQAADRRLRRNHAVELSNCDDHAQGRLRARRRLHDRREALGRNAALRTRARQAGA